MSKLNLAHDALAKFDFDAEKSHTLPGYYYYDSDDDDWTASEVRTYE